MGNSKHRSSWAEPLRVALIGTGFGSRVQLPGFMSLADTTVVALCGRSEDKTRAIAQEYGINAVYTDYEQMLVDVQPDIVSVTAPPRLHNPMVLAALQVGAHVMCEKPLALNNIEGHEMLAEAEARGRIHVVDHEFRYIPAHYYQRVLIDQGYVGEPMLLEATVMSSRHLDAAQPWTWWSERSEGGGVLNALGSHFIDLFRWMTGQEVTGVTATASSYHALRQKSARAHALGPDIPFNNMTDASDPERGTPGDDTAVLALELTGGLSGVVTLSSAVAGEIQRLAIHGTEGALIAQDSVHLWGRRRDQPLNLLTIPPEYEPQPWLPEENLLLGPFAKLAGLMVDAVRGESLVSLPTFRDGLAVQRVLDAAHESSATGVRVLL